MPQPQDNKLLERTEKLLLSVAGVALIFWFFGFSNRGYDFTDEGFYLQWSAFPRKYEASTTQFGFIVHPFYSLVDGNIIWLRQLNIALLLVLAAGMAFIVTSSAAISCALAASSLVYFSTFILTPSYNSLNFDALLLVAAGILIPQKSKQAAVVSAFLIGAGGSLCFLSKPTTAAALACATLIGLMSKRPIAIKTFLLSIMVAAALCVLSAMVIDGSMGGFIARLTSGAEDAAAYDPRYNLSSLFRLDPLPIDATIALTGLSSLLVFAALNKLANFPSTRPRILSITALIIWTLIIWITIQKFPSSFGFKPALTASYIAPLVVCVALLLLPGKARPTPNLAQALFLALLPFVAAFGTNNNYWVSIAPYSIFWIVAAGVLMLANSNEAGKLRRWQNLSWMSLALAAVSLQAGAQTPYRQPGPHNQSTAPVTFSEKSDTIFVHEEFQTYIEALQTAARSHGFTNGTPVIDMTGHSPGSIFAMGGYSVGAPWLLGHKRENNFAQRALSRVPCKELKRSWILVEKLGHRKHDPTILQALGIDLDQDYELAGTFNSHTNGAKVKQDLLKPKNVDHQAMGC